MRKPSLNSRGPDTGSTFHYRLRVNTGVVDGHGLFSLVRRPVLVNSNQSPEYGDIHPSGREARDFLFVRFNDRRRTAEGLLKDC